MNEVIPVGSGRSFRISKFNKTGIFEKYRSLCQSRDLLLYSKSFVLYKWLKNEKVHYDRSGIVCDICSGSRNNFEQIIERHKRIVEQQAKFYSHAKRDLMTGKSNIDFLIVEDFAQVATQKSAVQDLIIVIYQYSAVAGDHLSKDYLHFIGT